MSDYVYCSACSQQGKQNRCYITGYNIRCNHDNGWALTKHKSGNSVMKCSSCPGNQLFITGYDIKCGHDNGWAYCTITPTNANATCVSCSKQLNGKWSMETNPSNVSYQTCTTGRYLGISDGYFLYNSSPNWVYSYCRPCWIVQIKNTLPSLGIVPDQTIKDENNSLKTKISQLENELSQIKNQNTQNLSKITDLENSKKNDLNELNVSKAKVIDLENSNKTLAENIRNLNIEISELQSKNNQLENENTNLKSKISDIENETQTIQSNFDEIKQKIIEIEIEKKCGDEELKKLIANVSKLEDENSLLKVKLANIEDINERKENNNPNLKQENGNFDISEEIKRQENNQNQKESNKYDQMIQKIMDDLKFQEVDEILNSFKDDDSEFSFISEFVNNENIDKILQSHFDEIIGKTFSQITLNLFKQIREKEEDLVNRFNLVKNNIEAFSNSLTKSLVPVAIVEESISPLKRYYDTLELKIVTINRLKSLFGK